MSGQGGLDVNIEMIEESQITALIREQQRTNQLLAHICDQMNDMADNQARLADALIDALQEEEPDEEAATHLDGTPIVRGTHHE